jgi:hypothetical protein
LNIQVQEWWKSNYANFKGVEGKKLQKTAAINLGAFFNFAPKEIVAEFIDRIVTSYKNSETWYTKIVSANSKIAVQFQERMESVG